MRNIKTNPSTTEQTTFHHLTDKATTPQSNIGVDHPHKLLTERSSYSCGDVILLNLKIGELENNCQASGNVPQSLKLYFKYTQYMQMEGNEQAIPKHRMILNKPTETME
jgi:hypothetical protein